MLGKSVWRAVFLPAAAVLLSPAGLSGQNLITTFAGTEWILNADGRPARGAGLGASYGLALDRSRRLLISDLENRRVFRWEPDGTLTTVAGNGLFGYSGEGGSAVNAALSGPAGIAVAEDDTLYIADGVGNRVLRVSPDGIITTLAGTGRPGASPDGIAARDAALSGPFAVAVDAAGAVYIADRGNHRVRKVLPGGTIETVAGTGAPGLARDGVAALGAPLNSPAGLAAGADGSLFVSESGNHRVLRILPDGTIRNYAGALQQASGCDSCPATQSELLGPRGISLDAAGNLYIAAADSWVVVKVAPDGLLTRLAGMFGVPGTIFPGPNDDDAPAVRVSLGGPRSAVMSPRGELFIADSNRGLVRQVDAMGIISTVAGGRRYKASPDGTSAIQAFFSHPAGLAFSRSGALAVADADNNQIRSIGRDGAVAVLAGLGARGVGHDPILAGLGYSPALASRFDSPADVAFLSNGYVVADTRNHVIWYYNFAGERGLVAGRGQPGFNDTANSLRALLNSPAGLATDGRDNVYIADTGNHRVRRVNDDSEIVTVAGNGRDEPTRDDVSATAAALSFPSDVAVAPDGSLYIADSGHHRIRRVAGGVITTVAGSGEAGYSGDGGAARDARLNYPTRIALDRHRNLYIADTRNHAVRRVSPDGVISTLAGSGIAGLRGDGGPPQAALLSAPSGLAVDAEDNVYVSDTNNDRVRVIYAAGQVSVSRSREVVEMEAASRGAKTPETSVEVLSSLPGAPFSVRLSPESARSWLTVTPQEGRAPAFLRISADPSALAPGVREAQILVSLPLGQPPELSIRVRLTVTEAAAGGFTVSPLRISLSGVEGGGEVLSPVAVFGEGGAALSYRFAPPPVSWLAVEPLEGSVAAGTPVARAKLSGLSPGVYETALTLLNASGPQAVTIPVTLTVSERPQKLVLSKAAINLVVAEGGGAEAQTVAVINRGGGSMPWKVEAAGGSQGRANWLSFGPAEGVSRAGERTPPLITLAANTRGLAPGTYRGELTVRAPGAANAPQTILATLVVTPAGDDPGPHIAPYDLLFVGVENGESPGSQTVTVVNSGARPLSYRSSRTLERGSGRERDPEWLVHAPSDGVMEVGGMMRLVVQPDPAGLLAGAYRGTLALQFSNGRVRQVSILFLVLPPGRSGGKSGSIAAAIDDCSPSAALLGFARLEGGSAGRVGFPSLIQVRALDDCGSPIDSGLVLARFQTDRAVRLEHVGAGLWEGTWFRPASSAPDVRVTISAESGRLAGSIEQSFALRADPRALSFSPPGIVNQANRNSGAPLAPGTRFSVFGRNLSTAPARSATDMGSGELGGVTVRIAGRSVPLHSVAADQIDGVLPTGLPPNSSYQVLIQQGDKVLEDFVPVAEAQPGIFTQDGDPQGAGRIFRVGQNAAETLAGVSNPVRPGDRIAVYCTGLGEVQGPAAADGEWPAQAARVARPVSLTIGGQAAADVVAQTVPGQPGVYVIQATVPAGIPFGPAVRVQASVAGRASQLVTIAAAAGP